MSEQSGGTHPRDLLSAYLDDELTLDERHAVDRHLALCERCRKDLLSLKALARAVGEEPVPAVPPELAMRISRRLDEAQVVPIRRRRGFVIPATIAATAAAVGILAVVQMRERIDRQPRLASPEAPPAAAAPSELQKSRTADEGQRREESREDRPAAKDVFQPPAGLPERQADLKAKQNEVRYAPVPEEREPMTARSATEPPQAAAEPAPAPAPQGQFAVPSLEREAAKKEAEQGRERAVAGATSRLDSLGYVGGKSPTACAERWVDTAVLASWSVTNADSAMRDLEGIARANGGRVERVDPYPSQFALIVPRGQLPNVLADLRRHGVTGLDALISPEDGFDCVRQRVEVTSR
ncbi:MAG TPA: zf-HC2 domain-containing protein [Candidatus Polarisedimenticolaceae bacterium]|nr:zf-HC2 domain-containing protein [Candidatus Polarisedimenticolaceae bacterium]